MTDSDRLQAWAERVAHIDELTRNLSQELTSLAVVPPVGAASDATVVGLVDLWRTLGFGDPGRSPAHVDAGQAMAARLEGALGSASAWRTLAANLDNALNYSLGRGATHPDIVRTADFGGTLMRHETDNGVGSTRVIFAAPLSGLPAAHPLRSALPADDYFKAELGEPTLVLGTALPGGGLHDARPRPWYFRSSVLSLTRGWRLSQRQRDQEAADREALDKAERLRLYQESPAGREAGLKARIQELEARAAATGTGGF